MSDQPTDRPRLDQLTDAMLGRLYADLDRMKLLVAASSEDGQAVRMAASFAEKANEQRARAEQAEAELAVSREVARSNRKHVQAIVPELEQAEAAIARVRALHAPVQYGKWTICGHCSGYGGGSCDNGAEPHPCATLRALDGTA